MASQGNYDPALYVPGNTATYPVPLVGVLYQPGMFWDVNPAGIFDGVPLALGDRIYVTGHGRLYGDFLFGDDIYGGPADRDWTSNVVTFEPWISTLPPDLTDPYPYSGCPLGDRHPGWRIIIDCLFNSDEGSRTYGTLTYGDGVYGDADGRGDLTWTDITEAGYSVTALRGNPDGSYIVNVDQIVVEITDPVGEWFDFVQPISYYRPTVGDALRVGVADPDLVYYPLACGEIERITDEHQQPPRLLTVEAFGFVMDLVTTIPQYQSPGIAAQQAILQLLSAAGWKWGQPVEYPIPVGPTLLDEGDPADVIARDELDLIAASAGWTMDTDVRGSLRFRTWPLVPSEAGLIVIDCADHGVDGLLAGFTIFADYDAMLNIAQMTNTDDVLAELYDWPSVGKHGHRSENLGYPVSGSHALAADMPAILERVIARLGNVVVRVGEIEADSAVDAGWVPVLAVIDTGQAATVHRLGLPNVLVLDTFVTGVEHRIEPNRWRSTVYTSTTNQSTA